MIGMLPETLSVGGKDYPIRTDYRNILQAFEAFNDPELENAEKWIVAIYLIFEGFNSPEDVMEAAQNGFCLEEAVEQIVWFISAGKKRNDGRKEPPTYDWEQDEQMIFAAVNDVAKKEVREAEYMHWWTFAGYFNEIKDGTFSYIVGIREKINHGKKLEKNEREFLNKNKDIVLIKKKLTEKEQEQEDEFKALLNDVIG